MERVIRLKEELARLEEELRALSQAAPEDLPPVEAPAEAPVEAPVEVPVEAPVEVPVEAPVEAAPEDLPEDLPEERPEDLPGPAAETFPEEPIDLSITDEDIAPAAAGPVDIMEAAPAPASPAPSRKTILDNTVPQTAVMDVMAERQAWRIDRPGSPVKNIISAISLNDRVLLINTLFKEDPLLFQDAIAAFNAMGGLEEAVSYIAANFPEWKLDSEPVYRLMMAVRRKLQ